MAFVLNRVEARVRTDGRPMSRVGRSSTPAGRALGRPRRGGALETTRARTPYDVLGVPRSASDKTIRAAFHKTAKALHPDLNAGDLVAEQHLRQVIAAYEVLKNPQHKAELDQQLAARDRNRRRELVRRFAATTGAGLVSGSIVAAIVWVSVSLSHTREAF